MVFLRKSGLNGNLFYVQVLRLLGGDEGQLQDREAPKVHRPRHRAHDLRQLSSTYPLLFLSVADP